MSVQGNRPNDKRDYIKARPQASRRPYRGPRKDAPTVGIIVSNNGTLELHPFNKKSDLRDNRYNLPISNLGSAKEGDIVAARDNAKGNDKNNLSGLNVLRILGQKDTPGILTLISLYEQGLTETFNAAVQKETENLTVPALTAGREDLRNIPLVTVDGADSRDFDDAIYAEDTADGGKHLIVAIADVSYYVRPGSELDKEALSRGNSTYFPDRAVPMLPEALSNGLCSLKPNEDRAVMVYHLWIDKDGNLTNKKINRGLMRSAARITYDELQAARDGSPSAQLKPLMNTVVGPLYEAWKILRAASEKRGALDFESDKNAVDSHDVIAQFMILANVAGNQTLAEAGAASLHRFHDLPEDLRLEMLAEELKVYGLSLPKDTSDPIAYRPLLDAARQKPEAEQILSLIIRSMSKAVYDPINDGHFGLALAGYGHHTSPIRRYADLINHRSLVKALNLGDGGLTSDATLPDVALHINDTEYLSSHAERAAVKRFAIEKLSHRANEVFKGRVTGIFSAGVYVRINGTDGVLFTREGGPSYRAGEEVQVRITNAEPFSANLVLKAVNDNTAPAQKKDWRNDKKSKKAPQGPRRG